MQTTDPTSSMLLFQVSFIPTENMTASKRSSVTKTRICFGLAANQQKQKTLVFLFWSGSITLSINISSRVQDRIQGCQIQFPNGTDKFVIVKWGLRIKAQIFFQISTAIEVLHWGIWANSKEGHILNDLLNTKMLLF